MAALRLSTRRVAVHALFVAVLLAMGGLPAAMGCATPSSTDGFPFGAGPGGNSAAPPVGTTTTPSGADATAPGPYSGDAATASGSDSSDLDASVASPVDAASAPWMTGIPLTSSSQDDGDPAAGFAYLANGGYFGCGIPQRFFNLVSPFATLAGIPNQPLPGRDVTVGGNPLPYNWNLATDPDPANGGLQVVYMNCLQCHAGQANGKLVIGLGNVDADWTQNLANAAGAANLLGLLIPTPAEQAQLDKFIGRLKVIGPAAVMTTVGDNPAEMLATTFVSHRDINTLAWSDTALFTIPGLADLPAGQSIASKVPPWWRMSKVYGQFYTAMGRGDHRRSEMLAGSLCTDSIDEANAIDVHFKDVNAYIRTVKPPPYPFPINTALADQGHTVFTQSCAPCHGTYAPDAVTYPNLVIPHDTILTDDYVSRGGTTPYYGSALVDWYNESWYGQVGHYVPQNAYIAPPLDGVWAIAPYLHNGSVPDVATLLDSSKRPKYWTRVDHDSTHYDQSAMGFPWTAQSSGQTNPPMGVAAKNIYDTTQPSHGNTGHTFGDALTDQQRTAVIEYLKTL
jgi:mono/diheme cytochrome c family protein